MRKAIAIAYCLITLFFGAFATAAVSIGSNNFEVIVDGAHGLTLMQTLVADSVAPELSKTLSASDYEKIYPIYSAIFKAFANATPGILRDGSRHQIQEINCTAITGDSATCRVIISHGGGVI